MSACANFCTSHVRALGTSLRYESVRLALTYSMVPVTTVYLKFANFSQAIILRILASTVNVADSQFLEVYRCQH